MFPRIIALALLLCQALPSEASRKKRGSCIILCSLNGPHCPSGYQCRSNGCGSQCYRGPNYQPADCPMVKCAHNCPLGYVRDARGCEGCQCDYSALLTVNASRVDARVATEPLCLNFCGEQGVQCPSGYECLSNGCGQECFRTTNYQPADCPRMKCAHSCPVGYKRNAHGCEGCECDLTALQGCRNWCLNTGVKCPTKYECIQTQCGSMCIRQPGYQPAECPLLNCVSNCPLGYKRLSSGCETCQCDWSAIGIRG